MRIQSVSIKNFRLLEEADLFLEERTTVIVGRNNSGKTSLAELFRRLLTQNLPTFDLEDFSLGVHDQFWNAFALKNQGANDDDVRKSLPVIEAKLKIIYNGTDPEFGLLSDFIIDLNEDCVEALIEMKHQLEDGKIEEFFDDIELDASLPIEQQKNFFFQIVKERIGAFYKTKLFASDPNDSTNQKPMEWSKLRMLLQSGFINAQRELDDNTDKERDVLGKILEVLFATAMSESAAPSDRESAEKFEKAVQVIQKDIDVNFGEQMRTLMPAFALFGYPGLSDPQLLTETKLDMRRLLTNHTKIRYSGLNGIHLPETYNGLGTRNLIYILLKLLEFFKSFKATRPLPGINLVFIEEPEAHLHPQMQEVFVNKLGDIADIFAREYNDDQPWPVQFVVTTHSSHMANKASFGAIRYFLATENPTLENVFKTKIKDLGKAFGAELGGEKEFLHQYMTLTRCDLLFADKAILIEGTSERLLMPRMIEKIDQVQTVLSEKLGSQYLSVMEVGGAYAHKFFNLLNFLELRTLIITDLDSVNHNDNGKACKVSEGTKTSNACIKNWFNNPAVTPSELIGKAAIEKINGIRCIAYQVKESSDSPCGRSFEDAFILANPTLFSISAASVAERESQAFEKAKEIKKSDFALKYAIEETNWVVPLYIKEGLAWLAKNTNSAVTPGGASPPPTSSTVPSVVPSVDN